MLGVIQSLLKSQDEGGLKVWAGGHPGKFRGSGSVLQGLRAQAYQPAMLGLGHTHTHSSVDLDL